MLRVLNVLNSSHRRGAEAFGLDLGAALDAAGVSVRTVALIDAGPTAAHAIEALSAKGARALSWLRPLVRLARESDVIIGHGGRTLLAGSIVGTLTRTPFVYRVIGEPGAWAASPARRLRVAAELRTAARVVVYYPAVGADVTASFHVPAQRVVVIPKGIDPTPFPEVTPALRLAARARLGLPADPDIVLYLGALTAAKNVDQVVRAAGEIPGSLTVIVGDGPERVRFEEMARAAPDRVRVLPAVAAPLDALHAADVLALTSRTEGVPTVLLEAALAGLPVVATPVGGVAGVVVDGKTGYLVPLDDLGATTTALGDALRAGPELGRAGRQHCLDHHSIEHVVDRWVSVLEGAARRRSRRA